MLVKRLRQWMRHGLRSIGLLVATGVLAACGSSSSDAPQIAAASDLRLALTEVAEVFEAETGLAVELNFGSSGNFHRQLMQDAPFEMFLSADEDLVRRLAGAGKTVDEGRLYAIGRLVLIAPHGSPLALDPELAGLRAAIAAGQITRFAIANPDHAPYGQRAQEALVTAGLWDALGPRLVLGENVSQASQFALEGGAEGGIVAWSLVFDPAVEARASHVLLPESLHQPLRQRMVLMNHAGDTARRFYAFVGAPRGQEILARYGFSRPAAAG